MTTQTVTLINPYEVLDVHPGAAAAEITKAFAIATKKRKYPLGAIAKARKQLMNPSERLLADYLQPILPTPHRFKRSDFSQLNTSQTKLHISPKFDNLDLLSGQNFKELSQHTGNQLFPVSQSPLKLATPVSLSPAKLTRQEEIYIQKVVKEIVHSEHQNHQKSNTSQNPPQPKNKSGTLKLLTWSVLITGCSSFTILIAGFLFFQRPNSIKTHSSPPTLTNQNPEIIEESVKK